jgi:hypothetical protein
MAQPENEAGHANSNLHIAKAPCLTYAITGLPLRRLNLSYETTQKSSPMALSILVTGARGLSSG